MGFLNSLGLRRPVPPRCSAQGRFDIAGVTVINPAQDRREGASIGIADGAISGISEQAAVRKLGRVEPGAPADILLFRRDPTQALDHLSSLEAVVAGGRLYRIADLKAALASNQAYFASPLIKPLARRGAERALARALGRV
jgi:hypothetical protein